MAFIGYNIGDKMRMGYDPSTGEAGTQIKLTNKTGVASVKGTILHTSTTTDEAVAIESSGGLDPCFICAEAGVADGSEVWVWTTGAKCQVLLEDTTASTRGYWVKTSETTAGRADATNAAPAGGTIAALEDHLQEVGHCLQSKTAGTDVLALIVFHTL